MYLWAISCTLSSLSQLEVEQVVNRYEKIGCFPSGAIPKYLNLEPSLAMDWLEISWDDLRIKERVGAGNCLLPPHVLLSIENIWYYKLFPDGECKILYKILLSFPPCRLIRNSAPCWVAWVGKFKYHSKIFFNKL